jgi:hypothetical protein
MNLMQADVLNARTVLAPWGIADKDVSTDWHEGHVSVVIITDEDEMTQEMLRQILETHTSINIPIVFKKPVTEEFRFNFDMAP